MRRIAMFVIALSLAASWSSVPLRASCGASYFGSVSEDFAEATAVFIGRVTVKEFVQFPGDNIRLRTVTTFDVERAWKGTASAVQVRSCGGLDPDGQRVLCGGGGARIDVGSRYLVFVVGEPLTVRCLPIAPLDGARDAVYSKINTEAILEFLEGRPRTR